MDREDAWRADQETRALHVNIGQKNGAEAAVSGITGEGKKNSAFSLISNACNIEYMADKNCSKL